MHASFPVTPVHQHAPAPAWRKAFLVALALWAVVALLAAVAEYSDHMRAGSKPVFSDKVVMYSLVFLPFSLLSGLLAAAFERAPPHWLRPGRLALAYLLTIAVFLPAYGLYEVAALTAFEGAPLPDLITMLFQPNAWNRWLDGLMITIAFMAQSAYSTWQRGFLQERASQDARRANLTMRLTLLQGQLEPYFLLSTLDGIGELVQGAERALATRALARLSDLLRYALRSSQQDWLSMADEIGFLRDYLELQSLRFGQRLQVDWDIADKDWANVGCPALLLHPLAEQSVALGLAGNARQCTVRIGLTLEGRQVRMRVCRAGGTPAARPALDATTERLQLLYGAGASLTFQTTPGGDCIEMAFPSGGPDGD
jgi:two-component system sensor histidine kinase AlgZ